MYGCSGMNLSRVIERFKGIYVMVYVASAFWGSFVYVD